MQYTATIWLFLLGLVQKKPFTLRAFFPVLVISLGVVCFMCSGTDGASQAGNLIALAEGVFFACLTVSSKRAAGTNPLGLTALANAFTGMLVFLLFPSALSGLAEMTAVEWAMMLVLGVIQVGLGYGCYNIGVQQVSAQKASVIALWEMILGPLWVALFLKEYPNFMVMAGCASFCWAWSWTRCSLPRDRNRKFHHDYFNMISPLCKLFPENLHK